MQDVPQTKGGSLVMYHVDMSRVLLKVEQKILKVRDGSKLSRC